MSSNTIADIAAGGGDVVLEQLRSQDPDPEILRQYMAMLKEEDTDIPEPDREGLYTDHRTVNVDDLLDSSGGRHLDINGHSCHIFYARIVNMLNDGMSPNIVVVGKERNGKSMAALRLFYDLHNNINVLRGDFDPERQVVYSVAENLMLALGSTRIGKMYEEANETLNKNDYNTDFNKAVASELRTQGKRENVNGFIGPEYYELDPRIRDKVDILIDLRKKQSAKVTGYELKHGRVKKSSVRYKYRDYGWWNVPKVPDDLRERYERIDNQFKGNYLRSLLLDVFQEELAQIEEQKTASI